MAEEEGSTGATIHIKRVKKVQGGAHGGAWKIAYADFVTAMMAFFLLLWLLNSVTQEQLEGISNYFAPASVAATTSGAGGVLGGQTISAPGSEVSARAKQTVSLELPPPRTGLGGDDSAEARKQQEEEEREKEKAATEAEIKKAEAQQFEKTKQQLRIALKDIPNANELAQSLLVDNTPEGLRIQIVDQEGVAMFPSGGSEPLERARALLGVVKTAVDKLPQEIAISGRTDSVPFGSGSGYTNWELSTDRANAARRYLLEIGLAGPRVTRVVGKADTDHLDRKNPKSATNRRLSIVLLKGTGKKVAAAPTQGGASSQQIR